MNLTILGKYGPYAKAMGGTSSYLISNENANVLIDAGSGSISRLQSFCSLKDLDLIVISHLHYDHMAELLILKYALREHSIPLYIPQTPKFKFNLLKDFTPNILTQDTTFNIKGLNFSFCSVKHPVETYSIKVMEGNRTLVYSSDCIYSTKLEDFAKKADILLIDSGYLQKGENAAHMCVEECAITGKNAQVEKLILTHINPNYNEVSILNKAKEVFTNSLIAKELETYKI